MADDYPTSDYPSADYPAADYPVMPSQEPFGVHRDDYFYDPQGVNRGEYDRTDIVVPPDPPPVFWER
jgi:hypothetical protein